jgi:hypothetical protein
VLNSTDKTQFLKFLDETCDDKIEVKSSFLNSPFSDQSPKKNFAITLSSKSVVAKFWFMLNIVCKDLKFYVTSTVIVSESRNSEKIVVCNMLVTYILLFENNFNLEHAKPFVIDNNNNNNNNNNRNNVNNNNNNNINNNNNNNNRNNVNNNVLINTAAVFSTDSLILNVRKQEISRTFMGKTSIYFNEKNFVFSLDFSI